MSGVILYRIIVFAVMSMNPDHEAKANVRVTVTTTAVIINLLVVLVLDEIYGAVAAWITELGHSFSVHISTSPGEKKRDKVMT